MFFIFPFFTPRDPFTSPAGFVELTRWAYEKTGYHPCVGHWRDGRGGACVLSVLAMAYGGSGDGTDSDLAIMEKKFGKHRMWFHGVLNGFDGGPKTPPPHNIADYEDGHRYGAAARKALV